MSAIPSIFFFSSRRRHTRFDCDWSSDVCSSDLKLTYEIMRPEDIGRPSNKLVLGKHSGRHALAARLKDLGVDLAGPDLDRAFKAFKNLADRKKEVYDEDLMAIVTDEATQGPAGDELDYLHVPGRAL